MEEKGDGLLGLTQKLELLAGNIMPDVVGAMTEVYTTAIGINKVFGQTNQRLTEVQDRIYEIRPEISALGGDITDVVTTVQEVAEATQRNVLITAQDAKELYSVQKLTDQSVKNLVENYQKVGVQFSKIGDDFKKSMNYIQSVGLNTKDVFNTVYTYMEQVNKFSFANGVEGLTKMAAKSSMLKVDMQQTFDMAEKALSPEGAIELTSAFQRMGLDMGELMNPLTLMNESLTNPQGLIENIARATKQFSYFDEKTKTFKISEYGMLAMREIAKQTNTTYDYLSKASVAANNLDRAFSQLNPRLIFKDKEEKEMIANLARMDKDGEYKINIGKDEIKLRDLSQEQILKLIEQQGKEATIEDTAKSQMDLSKKLNSDVFRIKELLESYLGKQSVTLSIPTILDRFVTKTSKIVEKVIPKSKEGAEIAQSLIQKITSGVQSLITNASPDQQNKVNQELENYINEVEKKGNVKLGDAKNELIKLIKESVSEFGSAVKEQVKVDKTKTPQKTTAPTSTTSRISSSAPVAANTTNSNTFVSNTSNVTQFKKLGVAEFNKLTPQQQIDYKNSLANYNATSITSSNLNQDLSNTQTNTSTSNDITTNIGETKNLKVTSTAPIVVKIYEKEKTENLNKLGINTENTTLNITSNSVSFEKGIGQSISNFFTKEIQSVFTNTQQKEYKSDVNATNAFFTLKSEKITSPSIDKYQPTYTNVSNKTSDVDNTKIEKKESLISNIIASNASFNIKSDKINTEQNNNQSLISNASNIKNTTNLENEKKESLISNVTASNVSFNINSDKINTEQNNNQSFISNVSNKTSDVDNTKIEKKESLISNIIASNASFNIKSDKINTEQNNNQSLISNASNIKNTTNLENEKIEENKIKLIESNNVIINTKGLKISEIFDDIKNKTTPKETENKNIFVNENTNYLEQLVSLVEEKFKPLSEFIDELTKLKNTTENKIFNDEKKLFFETQNIKNNQNQQNLSNINNNFLENGLTKNETNNKLIETVNEINNLKPNEISSFVQTFNNQSNTNKTNINTEQLNDNLLTNSNLYSPTNSNSYNPNNSIFGNTNVSNNYSLVNVLEPIKKNILELEKKTESDTQNKNLSVDVTLKGDATIKIDSNSKITAQELNTFVKSEEFKTQFFKILFNMDPNTKINLSRELEMA